jgi:hypothetical protein
MKKTITCLLILLVASSLTLTIVPYASSQTSNLQILDNYTFYPDSIGYLVVIGEIQNTGSSVVTNISIAGSIATDQVAAQGSGVVYANYLLPGQKAPFYMDFIPEGSGSASWSSLTKQDIQLTVYRAAQTSQYPYQDVAITSSEATPKANGEYWVKAELQNNGTQTAKNVMVVATYFNSEGLPVATGYIDPPIASFEAGATKTVNVPAWDLNQTIVTSDKKIAAYSLQVEAQSPIQTDGNFPVVSNNPTPVPANVTVPPENGAQTGGIDQTTIILVVIVTIALVAVAAVLIVRHRKQAQTEAFEPAEHTKKSRRERRNE